MNINKVFLRYIDNINEWIGRIVSFLIIPLVFLVVMEVILRYVFNQPTIWATEISVQLMAIMIFLGVGYGFLHNTHVKMDIFTVRLPRRAVAIIDLLTAIPFLFVCILILYKSIETALRSVELREFTPSLFASPLYPIKCLIPIGIFLLLTQGIAKFIRDFNMISNPKANSEERIKK